MTRSIGWMMAAALTVLAVACDHADRAAEASGGGGNPPASAGTGTPEQGEPVDTETRIEAAHDAIEAAAGDLCATLEAAGAPLGITPGTVTDAERAAGLIVSMIRHMGAVAGEDEAVYERVAERFEDDFDDSGHSPVWLRSPDAFAALDDPAFVDATARLKERATRECAAG